MEYNIAPNGRLQRLALILACHGPLGVVKGYNDQAKALVKRGYLNADLTPTALGLDAYDEMNGWLSWNRALMVTGARLDNPKHLFYGSQWNGTMSCDGATAYLWRAGSDSAVAIDASTIPNHARPFFGLDPRPELEGVG